MVVRWTLLVLAVLCSAAVAVVAGFAGYVFAQGYSGGSDPQSVSGLAFPLSLVILIAGGVPAALACAGAWIGYFLVSRNRRRSSG
jgi:hypothetical protein